MSYMKTLLVLALLCSGTPCHALAGSDSSALDADKPFVHMACSQALARLAFPHRKPSLGPEILDSKVEKPAKLVGALKKEIAARVAAQDIPAPAYFIVLFACQGAKNRAVESHTFASYVRVASNGRQEWWTISWLPAVGVAAQMQPICIFDNLGHAVVEEFVGSPCRPVTGHNYNLAQTLNWACSPGKTLAVWGPYRISKALYTLGIERKRFLEAGGVDYLADDRRTRKSVTAINCMHAVSDLPHHFSGNGGFLGFGYKIWGIKGTQHVLNHLTTGEANWFLDSVCVDCYRKFERI